MSYNHALPIQFSSVDHERTLYKREFLKHPLCNIYDTRIVVSCEILEARGEYAFSNLMQNTCSARSSSKPLKARSLTRCCARLIRG